MLGFVGIWALLLALLRFLAQLDATHPGRGRAEFEELVRRLVPGLPDHELERWWAIALELKRRLPSTAEESLQLVAPLRPLVAAVRRSVAEQLRAEARQHLSNAERELTAGKIARRAWEQRRKQVFDKQARANKVEQEGEYLWDDEVTKAARALNVGLRIATRNAPAVDALALPGRPYIVVSKESSISSSMRVEMQSLWTSLSFNRQRCTNSPHLVRRRECPDERPWRRPGWFSP